MSANARRQFVTLTKQWNIRLQGLPQQDPAHAFLPELLGFFDPIRWTAGQDEQGCERWIYSPPVPPENSSAANLPSGEADSTGSRDIVYVFEVPEKCSRCLDGQDEAFAADPAAPWDMLMQLMEAANREGASNLPPIYGTSAFALMAVLLVKCRDWLRAHPKAEEFCRQSVLDVPFSTQPPSADQRMLAGNQTLQGFYTVALVALWAESPASEELRHRVANLAAVGTDAEVAALCRQAYRFRGVLGGSFLRLQSFVVDAAQERSRHHYARALRDAPERFADWFSKAGDAFARGNNR